MSDAGPDDLDRRHYGELRLMPRYDLPRCEAPDPDDRKTGKCGVSMRVLGERHPSFGPNYRPGGTVFECSRCGAVRFIEDQRVDRYMTKTRS